MADAISELMASFGPAIRSPVSVAVDAEVIEYDASGPTVDVRPLVKKSRVLRDGTRQTQDNTPIIYGVPVQWPNAGGRSITWGIDPGDRVLLVIRDRSHDEVDNGSATPATPSSTRRFDMSDARALPGSTLPGSLEVEQYRSDGQPVWALDVSEALHVGASTASLLLGRADLILAELQSIAGHNHPYLIATGPGVTGSTAATTSASSYSAPAAAADIASDRIKVDS